MLELFLIVYSSNPPNGYAGNPPGNNYCSACHFGPGSALHSTTRLVINGLPHSYTPGQTYDLTVIVYRSGSARFGFQAIIQDSNNVARGLFNATGSNVNVDGAYVEHQNAPYASDSFAFSFQWTAPSSDVGTLYMYTVGNAADGDGNAYENGDTVFYRVDTIYAPSTAVAEGKPFDIQILPYGIKVIGASRASIHLYTIDGKVKHIYSGNLKSDGIIHIPQSGIVGVHTDRGYRTVKFVRIR